MDVYRLSGISSKLLESYRFEARSVTASRDRGSKVDTWRGCNADRADEAIGVDHFKIWSMKGLG